MYYIPLRLAKSASLSSRFFWPRTAQHIYVWCVVWSCMHSTHSGIEQRIHICMPAAPHKTEKIKRRYSRRVVCVFA